MSGVLAIAGTDTDIGKTVVAAGLAAALDARYWKPVQAGTEGGTDSERAIALGVPADHVLSEAYRLALPASPHRAASVEGVAIDPARLALPPERPLIVELAGGLMVPLSLDPPSLYIDQLATWRAPALLVARTGLGTINHSLLSIEALRARRISLSGLIFVGEDEPESIEAILRFGQTRSLGRLPRLDPLDAASLAQAVATHIDIAALHSSMSMEWQA
jgi:dethiobiotin synthetase